MLFVRTYHGMLGGHLKVFDYMHHVRASGLFEPVLYLTPDSTESPREWLPAGVKIIDRPVDADAYFVGGFNWRLLDDAGIITSGAPVVNLLQGLRHVVPSDPRRPFLARAALRICVSPAVYEGVRDTGLANGPLALIRNGIDVDYLTNMRAGEKRRCVFVAGSKNPDAAQVLGAELARRGFEHDVCAEIIPRGAFLARMSGCDIVVALPEPHEGFFLPPLEAMAMGCATVLAQCAGAASYCMDGRTCLSPPFDIGALADAVTELRGNETLFATVRDGGIAIAKEHSIERERREFRLAMERYLSDM